jgi:uncharacterized protein (UPF0333 family)
MRIGRTVKAKHRQLRGAISIEYMLVLTLVVLPLALMTPLMFGMITSYTNRMIWAIALPFG